MLLDLQKDKVVDAQYNDKEYIDNCIQENEMKIEGDIVVVNDWQFKVDRETLKIIESLGKYVVQEEPKEPPEGWKGIYNEDDLRKVVEDLTGNYMIMKDIQLTANWTPIGNNTNMFTGKLDGSNHKITGLNIEGEADYQGLFGCIGTDGKVNNLTVQGNVSGSWGVGMLAGVNHGTIEYVKTNGNVTGTRPNIGGLVGYNMGGRIKKASSSGTVKGLETSNVGGLVGTNTGEKAVIMESYSDACVEAYATVGGLVGDNQNGEITNCYSIGSVSISGVVGGGLVGHQRGKIKNSYTLSKIITSVSDCGRICGKDGAWTR